MRWMGCYRRRLTVCTPHATPRRSGSTYSLRMSSPFRHFGSRPSATAADCGDVIANASHFTLQLQPLIATFLIRPVRHLSRARAISLQLKPTYSQDLVETTRGAHAHLATLFLVPENFRDAFPQFLGNRRLHLSQLFLTDFGENGTDFGVQGLCAIVSTVDFEEDAAYLGDVFLEQRVPLLQPSHD